MAISLRKIGVQTETIIHYLNSFDIENLPLDNIEILLRMVPNQQEIQAYKEYEISGKPINELTDEDKFLFQLSKVDRLEQKLKIMFFMKNLAPSRPPQDVANGSSNPQSNEDILVSIKNKIKLIETASNSLRSCEGIRILLEYLLVFGNYLNSSSRSLASAPAYGFRLQALDMVMDAKSTQDRSKSLLHYVVETILNNLDSKEKANLSSESYNDSSLNAGSKVLPKRISPIHSIGGTLDTDHDRMPYNFDDLLVYMERAAGVSLETISSEVHEYEKGMDLCIKELQLRGHSVDKAITPAGGGNNSVAIDEAAVRLQTFIKERSRDILEFRGLIKKAQSEFSECAQYFGENPRMIESSTLFSTFLRLLKNFRQCQVDNKTAQRRKFDEELRQTIQQQQALRAANRKKLLHQKDQLAENALRTDINANNDLLPTKTKRLIQQEEVSHGTLDVSKNIFIGIHVEILFVYRKLTFIYLLSLL